MMADAKVHIDFSFLDAPDPIDPGAPVGPNPYAPGEIRRGVPLDPGIPAPSEALAAVRASPLARDYAEPIEHVYVLSHGGEPVYVGRAANLNNRLGSHRRGTMTTDAKTFDAVDVFATRGHQTHLLELALIRFLRPPLNSALTGSCTTRDLAVLRAFGVDVPEPENETQREFLRMGYDSLHDSRNANA